MRPAVFLDRDGTLIEDTHYPRDPNRVVLLPTVGEGLRLLRQKGYSLFVVSNQSGVSRGKILEEEFLAVHQQVDLLLQRAGVAPDRYFYCLHHPEDACRCRKPGTDLIPRAFLEQPLALERSYFVGDKDCDLLAAESLGISAALVLTGYGEQTRASLPEPQLQRIGIYAQLLDFCVTVPQAR